MAHTPGPWINDNGMVTGQETRPRYAPGVSIDLFDVGEYPDELREEMLANAALISAALDLLASLKQVLGLLRRAQDICTNHIIPDGTDAETAMNEMIELLDSSAQRAIEQPARAALAKAEGSTNG